MFRVIVPRVIQPSLSSKFWEVEPRSTWRMMENINRNMERMMEDAYNDIWSCKGGLGELAQGMRVSSDPSKFEMTVNVEDYKPEEIDVKLDGRHLQISAKHEEKQDEHGYIAKQFSRRVLIPENVDLESLESSLSTDGLLTMKAKVSGIENSEGPRPIEIKRENSTTNKKESVKETE